MIGEYTIRRSRKSIIPSIGFVLVFALLIVNACLLFKGMPVAGSDNAEHETAPSSPINEGKKNNRSTNKFSGAAVVSEVECSQCYTIRRKK